jgi:ribosomal protein L14
LRSTGIEDVSKIHSANLGRVVVVVVVAAAAAAAAAAVVVAAVVVYSHKELRTSE